MDGFQSSPRTSCTCCVPKTPAGARSQRECTHYKPHVHRCNSHTSVMSTGVIATQVGTPESISELAANLLGLMGQRCQRSRS